MSGQAPPAAGWRWRPRTGRSRRLTRQARGVLHDSFAEFLGAAGKILNVFKHPYFRP